MNITQIEANVQAIFSDFKQETFIYDLLAAYGTPQATIKKIQLGALNLSKNDREILWKKKLYFAEVQGAELLKFIDDVRNNEIITKQQPRFFIVTNYQNLLAYDTKTNDSLDCDIAELTTHFTFFLPLAGMEKMQHQEENVADVKAAEKMAKLYDEIRKDNPGETADEIHSLNVFLSRLLFCFFAEDTGIFEKSQFTHSVNNHTQDDGSDLNTYLDRIFEVMDQPEDTRSNIPQFLNEFPYVNGGLFRDRYSAPRFSRKSRQLIIECGELNWSAINPDIFGSMIQAVITPEHRGGLGMHYTSVPNIMKVISPLFLDELYELFEDSKGNTKKLNELLRRIWNIKIFDPACGSGNFLIIAYKELRKLEMQIFKEIDRINGTYSNQFTGIRLDHFYGIELDDFAHEIAILSLWLAEHQMNQLFLKEFGRVRPALPLTQTGNIVHGNATRIDWEAVCTKSPDDEVYLLGNPPYLGARLQNEDQKKDMQTVFSDIKGYNNLDYISAWFFLGKKYIMESNSKYAFVSTNSICQGTQVSLLWPHLLKDNIEISFVHRSFKWKNNAKSNAGVSVMIIGLRTVCTKPKYIFSENIRNKACNINAYGIDSDYVYLEDRKDSISGLPTMTYGSMPNDNGELILNEMDANEIRRLNSNASYFIKDFLGAEELINGIKKYCLWIDQDKYEFAKTIEPIALRVERVRKYREASKRIATQKLAKVPFRFGEVRHQNGDVIVIPQTTSELREYIPIGYLNSDVVISNAARVIYNAEPWLFGLLTSKIHKVWINTVAGRLETRIQYSNTLCYNTFPCPLISESTKNELDNYAFKVLEQRELNSEKTLAQLYDPDKMPEGLRKAHHELDLAVERCYRSKPFESDEERLEYLFKLYEQMIEAEKSTGTLFDTVKKKKK